MNADVENEAKLHITNGIEKASSSTGVDIKVSSLAQLKLMILTTRLFLSTASLQTSQRADGQTIRTLIPLCHGRGI